jgi:hypothetical protein
MRTPLVAVAVALAILSGCSGSHESPTDGGPVERVVFSDGLRLHLARFDGTTLVTVATAQIPEAGLHPSHSIFGLMKHPTRPWLYTTSLADWAGEAPNSWEDPRIDRFAVGRNSIAWAGVVHEYAVACNPVNGAFSPSGSRLYVKNNDFDLEIFQVDPDGALTLLSSADTSTNHFGVAVDPSGVTTYVYTGGTTVSVEGDVAVPVGTGGPGNSTRYLPMPGDDLLLSTTATNGLAMYSLADPADPAMIASVAIGTKQARAVAINDAMNGVIVVGQNKVATYGWDGGAFTPQASLDPHVGTTPIENREVTYIGDDTRAAVSWFYPDPTAVGSATGGVSVYEIDPSGAITTLGTVTLPRASGVVRSLRL